MAIAEQILALLRNAGIVERTYWIVASTRFRL
jgi:hypothetical protein